MDTAGASLQAIGLLAILRPSACNGKRELPCLALAFSLSRNTPPGRDVIQPVARKSRFPPKSDQVQNGQGNRRRRCVERLRGVATVMFHWIANSHLGCSPRVRNTPTKIRTTTRITTVNECHGNWLNVPKVGHETDSW